MTRTDIFISYSHKNKKWLEDLREFLEPSSRNQKLVIWDDTRIKPGEEWRAEIQQALERAKVAVLLVSQSFLASNFIANKELPDILEAQKRDGLTIFWLAVTPTTYKRSPIEQFQAANDPERPLNKLRKPEREDELVRIVEKILEAVNADYESAAKSRVQHHSEGPAREASAVIKVPSPDVVTPLQQQRALEEAPGPQLPEPAGEIFISYMSEDIGAAKRLFGDLKQIGGDVAWFDKSALKAGDESNQQIRKAIQRCSLFLPLLSANTERATQGYFRLEWNDAAERALRIHGLTFIIPIVIDSDFSMQRYQTIPEQFKELQYSHAPAGQMTERLRAELRRQLRSLRRPRAV